MSEESVIEVSKVENWQKLGATLKLMQASPSLRVLYKQRQEALQPFPAVEKNLYEVVYNPAKYELPLPLDRSLNEKVCIYGGDICNLNTDVIVNACNAFLNPGSGVCGAVHLKAGAEELQEAAQEALQQKRILDKILKLKQQISTDSASSASTTISTSSLPSMDDDEDDEGTESKLMQPGECVITRGFRLPCKWVVHALGPSDRNPQVLKETYIRCLELAKLKHASSIALCCISAGKFGFPIVEACMVALKTVREWLAVNPSLHRVVFVCKNPRDLFVYETLMQLFFPVC